MLVSGWTILKMTVILCIFVKLRWPKSLSARAQWSFSKYFIFSDSKCFSRSLCNTFFWGLGAVLLFIIAFLMSFDRVTYVVEPFDSEPWLIGWPHRLRESSYTAAAVHHLEIQSLTYLYCNTRAILCKNTPETVIISTSYQCFTTVLTSQTWWGCTQRVKSSFFLYLLFLSPSTAFTLFFVRVKGKSRHCYYW